MKGFFKKHESKIAPGFFILGLLFDILTLGRIDDPLNIASQVLYLTILFSFLYFEFVGFPKLKNLEKVFEYKDEIVHFLLGALLSAYSIFYFKSASFSSSFIFLFIIFTLLILNELPFFQKKGIVIKTILLTLCLLTFFLYTIPLLLGVVGFWTFILSLVISLIFIFSFSHLLKKKGAPQKELENRLLLPSLVLVCFFIVFYLLRVIPPIPLSIQHIGIYHKVEKSYPKYFLYHYKPWWNFWHTGDQSFEATPEDKIYVFTRVFAPGGFEDKVILHFLVRTKDGYSTSDKIPLSITGGRKEGFRGYAYKTNYIPGDWRVQVETENGLEIGRINFEVESVQAHPGNLIIEEH